MNLILWIDQNTFASGLLEKVFKKAEKPFYTLETVRDFSYLVDDLAPGIIVLDQQTALKDRDQFLKQYNDSDRMKQTDFIVIGSWDGLEFIQHKKGIIERVFDPFLIPDQIKEIISQA